MNKKRSETMVSLIDAMDFPYVRTSCLQILCRVITSPN